VSIWGEYEPPAVCLGNISFVKRNENRIDAAEEPKRGAVHALR